MATDPYEILADLLIEQEEKAEAEEEANEASIIEHFESCTDQSTDNLPPG